MGQLNWVTSLHTPQTNKQELGTPTGCTSVHQYRLSALQVGVIGLFSDWPATTTFYANCKLEISCSLAEEGSTCQNGKTVRAIFGRCDVSHPTASQALQSHSRRFLSIRLDFDLPVSVASQCTCSSGRRLLFSSLPKACICSA
eukprot:6213506-Pleurochrysis_carterae.AAC.1